MKDKSLPKKKELMDAILTVMDTVDETIITSDMNDAVANLLKLPTDLLQIEEQMVQELSLAIECVGREPN